MKILNTEILKWPPIYVLEIIINRHIYFILGEYVCFKGLLSNFQNYDFQSTRLVNYNSTFKLSDMIS